MSTPLADHNSTAIFEAQVWKLRQSFLRLFVMSPPDYNTYTMTCDLVGGREIVVQTRYAENGIGGFQEKPVQLYSGRDPQAAWQAIAGYRTQRDQRGCFAEENNLPADFDAFLSAVAAAAGRGSRLDAVRSLLN